MTLRGGGWHVRRPVAIVTTTAVLLLATPNAAWAHGVSGGADSVGGFLGLGFRHMLLGWDHMLFIAGVVLLLAPEVERAMMTLSLFALGHSATLLTATLAGWRFDPVLVDMIVAMSLTFVGAVGWLGPPSRWRLFGIGVLAFGLAHGLGLATRLQTPALEGHLTVWRVLAFNVGVEMAQLFGAGIALLLGLSVWPLLEGRLSWAVTVRLAYTGLIVVGFGASVLIVADTVAGGPSAAEPAIVVKPAGN